MKRTIINTLLAITLAGFVNACKKEQITTNTKTQTLVVIDNIVFDTATSRNFSGHYFAPDTLHPAYTLTGFGAFAGKSRTVKFSDGGVFQGVPVIRSSGMDDFGYTFLAKDTSGAIWEIYRQKFNSSGILKPHPITLFAPKQATTTNEWNSTSGWEQGRNSQYFTFKTKIINTNATSSSGVQGCVQLEYSAPDYKDTIYFKPGRGPVEVSAWRAHLHENNQPAYGGFN